MSEDSITPLEVQGVFTWTGSEYRTLKNIGFKKFTRDRQLFYGLIVPNVKELTNGQVANSMIVDVIIDKGWKSERLITDPQKVCGGGFLQPATIEESTNNPGNRVWLGVIEIPNDDARFSQPTMEIVDGKLVAIDDAIPHNLTIMAALRNLQTEVGSRLFDTAHGGVTSYHEYNIVDDMNGFEYLPRSWLPRNIG